MRIDPMNKNKNGVEEKRFPVLHMVMRFYKIAARIIGVFYALTVGITVIDAGLLAGIVLGIAGFFVFVSIYASGEVIEVFLSFEESNRTLVEIQKRALQIQMRNMQK
jgi:hypothetical protein